GRSVNENARTRFRADNIIDDSAERKQLIQVVEFAEAVDVTGEIATGHSALRDGHSDGFGDGGFLVRDFRTIGETRDHAGILIPLAGEGFLSERCAVRILKAFDVSANDGRDSHSADEAVEIHDDARLIAIGAAEDDASFVGPALENWTECG